MNNTKVVGMFPYFEEAINRNASLNSTSLANYKATAVTPLKSPAIKLNKYRKNKKNKMTSFLFQYDIA